MTNPRPWVVVSGALAMGLGMSAAAASVLADDSRHSEVVGPGIVLTAEPSDDTRPDSRDEPPTTSAAADSPDAPVERARQPGRERPGQPTTAPDPPPASSPVPAPPPAPQPVTDSDSAGSASSADSPD